MAFSGSDPVLAKRRFFHAASITASVYNLSFAFFSWLNQQGGKPDLQVVELIAGTDTAQIICSGAATLRALILNKTTTTAAYAKFSNNATDFEAATNSVLIGQNVIDSAAVFYPKGLTFSIGISYESHTTPNGTTTSAAGDGATGVALISV
jgi:hypothetical protein